VRRDASKLPDDQVDALAAEINVHPRKRSRLPEKWAPRSSPRSRSRRPNSVSAGARSVTRIAS
jgi:hypothetical protein